MIAVAAFDDTTWKTKLENYRQTVIAERPILEAPHEIAHVPYPYQRMVYVTKKRAPAKLPLSRYPLPAHPLVTPGINIYWGIHQIVHYTRKLKWAAAALWADRWLDPFTFFYEDETPKHAAGGIDIDKAVIMAWSAFYAIGRVESVSLCNLYADALRAHEATAVLDTTPIESAKPQNVIQLPLVELSRYPRTCTVCGTKTSSGIRALCDSCHHRYIVCGIFKNGGIQYDELARAIIQADSRHRQNVMEAYTLKIAS